MGEQYGDLCLMVEKVGVERLYDGALAQGRVRGCCGQEMRNTTLAILEGAVLVQYIGDEFGEKGEKINQSGSMNRLTRFGSKMDSHMLVGLDVMALRQGTELMGHAFMSWLWYIEELGLGGPLFAVLPLRLVMAEWSCSSSGGPNMSIIAI